jgi:hypothetical protein
LDNVALIIIEETAPGSQGWFTWISLNLFMFAILYLRSLQRYFPFSGYYLLRCYPDTNYLVY